MNSFNKTVAANVNASHASSGLLIVFSDLKKTTTIIAYIAGLVQNFCKYLILNNKFSPQPRYVLMWLLKK